MSVDQFIQDNRPLIDAAIRRLGPDVGDLDDEGRRMWILRHPDLLLWALREGVRV